MSDEKQISELTVKIKADATQLEQALDAVEQRIESAVAKIKKLQADAAEKPIVVEQSINVKPGIPELIASTIREAAPKISKAASDQVLAAASKGGERALMDGNKWSKPKPKVGIVQIKTESLEHLFGGKCLVEGVSVTPSDKARGTISILVTGHPRLPTLADDEKPRHVECFMTKNEHGVITSIDFLPVLEPIGFKGFEGEE